MSKISKSVIIPKDNKADISDVKKIQVGVKSVKGFAIVDADNFEELNKFKWYMNNRGYVITRQKSDRAKKTGYIDVFMHRLVNKTPEGMITDHVNRNKLDNRKANLRTVDLSINAYNSKTRTDNTSGHKGISWSNSKKKWRADITFNGKPITLGLFNNLEDAIKVRNEYTSKNDILC